MFLAPHPPMKPHLEAIDIQDGDGQHVLLWGHQCVDPADEPSKQQCIQNLGDGIPGAVGWVLGWVGTMGGEASEAQARRSAALPGIHGTLHSQGGENLLSYCLLVRDVAPE